MNAVYGDPLLSSPELFQKAKLFNQKPLINGGYDERTPFVTIRGIFQDENSGVKDNHGNWVKTRNKTVWSRTKLPAGAFILFEGVVSRIMTDQDWPRQGGFYVYGLEKVIGDSGQPMVAPPAQLGGADF